MNNQDEYIFLNTISDIREKIESNDRYKIIKASGLLRNIFLDKSPLFHKINKNYKVKLNFETNRTNPPPGHLKPLFYYINLNFDSIKKEKHNLKEFLKIICFQYKEYKYSVKDIIRFGSHVLGGIHVGEPENEKERILNNTDKSMPFFDHYDSALLSIKSISEVCIKSLEPLENEIKKVVR